MSILLLISLSQRMHTWFCWGLGVLLLPLLTGFGPPQLLDRVYIPTIRIKVGEVGPVQEGRPIPTVSAQAFLLYDVDAQQLLVAQNIQEALAPASLTKLMTALLTLEEADLAATVTIQSSDLVGGARMGLRAGETVTVEDLLWGLLIPSGNDAAMALARHIGGTANDFVAKMNQRAQELGLAGTHFVNPHGLDAAGHTSSAADLLILTQLNWRYPLFRQIVTMAETERAGHLLRNTNELLDDELMGINGVKTGTTDRAGECLVAGINHNGHQLFFIILNSRERYVDTQALYQYYQTNYTWFDGQNADWTALNQLDSTEGATWYLRVEGKRRAWLVQPSDVRRLRPFRRLHLPGAGQAWEAGMPVGVLEWWLDEKLIGVQPLVLW